MRNKMDERSVWLRSLKVGDVVFIDRQVDEFLAEVTITHISPKRRIFKTSNGIIFNSKGMHFLYDCPYGKQYSYLRSKAYLEKFAVK